MLVQQTDTRDPFIIRKSPWMGPTFWRGERAHQGRGIMGGKQRKEGGPKKLLTGKLPEGRLRLPKKKNSLGSAVDVVQPILRHSTLQHTREGA